MANYEATSRTNYFHVTDEEAYQKLFARLMGEDSIVSFDEKDTDGRILHGFGSYSGIEYNPLPSDFEDVRKLIASDAVFDKEGKRIPPEKAEEQMELFNEKGDCIFCYAEEPDCIDVFVELLQKILPEDECFVYMEVGAEKLRYVVGDVIVATKTEMRYMSIDNFVRETVQEILGKKAITRICY